MNTYVVAAPPPHHPAGRARACLGLRRDRLSVLIDEDPTYLRKSGAIGLEVEATGKLFTRNIWLKKLN